MNDVDATGVKIYISLMTFIKSSTPHIITILNHFKLVDN
jgi:hypothetical protein